jgi:transcriptional antiterminator RfaH
LRFGDAPARVEEALIEQLRWLEQTALGAAESLYQPGDWVRIDEGIYAGLSAIYEVNDGDDRARVLIELLRRPARLTLPLASLRRDIA